MRSGIAWLLAAALLQTAAWAQSARPSAGKTHTTVRKRARKQARPRPVIDPTAGDRTGGDDLAIRRAAIDALAGRNGSVVVVDPSTGRVLTIVNQKLAFSEGFIPCSTIKLVTALAALSEGIVDRDTPLRLNRSTTMNMTTALAVSNNPYFAILGNRLGFERVRRYARMFGLGEKASLDIEGEQPGVLPREPPANGGVGRMTSFGDGILQTPLELAALLSAIANGGTLYYLQYPRSKQELDEFVPRIKRRVEIEPWLPDIKVGMRAAVEFGTARRAAYHPNEPVLGKTGTCTDYRFPTHMGWFGAFNDVDRNPLVVVVMLTGGSTVTGGVASAVAGSFYHQLSTQNYFAAGGGPQLYSAPLCCGL